MFFGVDSLGEGGKLDMDGWDGLGEGKEYLG